MATTIDELQIDINVNNNGVKALEDITKSLQAFNNSLKGITKKRISEIGAGLQEMVDAINGLTGVDKLDKVGKHLSKIAEPLKKIQESVNGKTSNVIAKTGAKQTELEKKKALESTKKGTKANKQFLSSLMRIAKYRLIRAALKAITTAVKNATNNLYTFDKFMGGSGSFSSSMDQLASSLIYLQNSFAAAFAPLIEVVVPILTTVMDKIADFGNKLGELFAKVQGKNVYTAATKSAVTYMQVAKQAQNATLGFDELNTTGNQMNISSMFEQVAVSESSFAGISDIVKDILSSFQGITSAVSPLLESVGRLANVLMPVVLELINKILVFTTPLIDFVTDLVEIVVDLLDGLSPIIDLVLNLVDIIISTLAPILDAVALLVKDLIDVLMPVLEPIITFIQHLVEGLEPIFELVMKIIEVVIVQIADVLEILKPLANLIGSILKFLEPILTFVNDMTFSIIAAALEGIVGILETMNAVLEGLIKAFVALFSGDMEGFVNAFKEMGNKIKAIWGDVGKNIANIFINAINKIIEGFESAINFFVKGINKIVDAINAVSTFFKGKTVNYVGEVSFSRIAAYATGGFPEDGLFFANHNELVGQFSNGQTAVANNEQIVEGISTGVYDAVVSAMGENNNSGDLKLNVYLDGRQLKASYDRLTRQQGYVIDAGGML